MALAVRERLRSALIRRSLLRKSYNHRRRSGVAAGRSSSIGFRWSEGGPGGRLKTCAVRWATCGRAACRRRVERRARSGALPEAVRRARRTEHRRDAGPIGDEEVMSSRTGLLVVLRFDVEESK